MEQQKLEQQNHINGIKNLLETTRKCLNHSVVVFFFLLLGFTSFGQNEFSFDKTKWILDNEVDSLDFISYRAYVISQEGFLDSLRGKDKREIINMFGEPDFINKEGFSSFENQVGFVYCIGKNTKDEKSNDCLRAALTIVIDDDIVCDIIILRYGG